MENSNSSPSAQSMVEQALDLMERRDLRGARNVLKAGCQRFPRDYLMHYNLACALSLLGQDLDDASLHLQRAVHLGYRNLDTLQTDPDLTNLRSHPGYPPPLACPMNALTNEHFCLDFIFLLPELFRSRVRLVNCWAVHNFVTKNSKRTPGSRARFNNSAPPKRLGQIFLRTLGRSKNFYGAFGAN